MCSPSKGINEKQVGQLDFQSRLKTDPECAVHSEIGGKSYEIILKDKIHVNSPCVCVSLSLSLYLPPSISLHALLALALSPPAVRLH